MRIVTRQQLMAMPADTVFHQWEPCYFHGMQIKGETCGIDFFTTYVPEIESKNSDEDADRQFEMGDKGASYPVDVEQIGREALFDDNLRYAVWEPDDVRRLIARLSRSLVAKG